MKKPFWLFAVAIIAVISLAFVSSAHADVFYNLTATGQEANGQNVNITAVLDLSSLGGGIYQLKGATGTVLDAYGTTENITGVPAGNYVDPFTFDNLVSIPETYSGLSSGGSYFDTSGILFTTSEAGYDVGIAPDEYYNDGHYQYADDGLNGSVNYTLGDQPYNTTDVTITLTPAAATAPEPSSLMLLGSGVLGIAGVARRKILGLRS